MKKNADKNVKLGIFVTVGLVLFLAGIYFIGQKQLMFSKTFRLSTVFRDIGGLQIGNNVRFSGINVGTITSVDIITDSTVRVGMVIDESTRKFIKKDARATIGSEGLMGNKIISISPGTEGKAVVQNNDVLVTMQPVSIDDILAKVKVTVDNAADITDGLASIVGGINDGKGSIGKLFKDSTFAKNMDQTVVNLKQSTKGLQQNMDAAKHSFLLRGFFKKKKKQEEKNKNKDN